MVRNNEKSEERWDKVSREIKPYNENINIKSLNYITSTRERATGIKEG